MDTPKTMNSQRQTGDEVTQSDRAVELIEVCLIAQWSYTHSIAVLNRAELLAKTAKLKNEWVENEFGSVDTSPEFFPSGAVNEVASHAKIIAQCLMQWGCTFNYAIDTLKLAKHMAQVHQGMTGWQNLTGLKIKKGPPIVRPVPHS